MSLRGRQGIRSDRGGPIKYTDVTLFAQRLQDVAPTARTELRKTIRKAGDELVQDVRGAASWSSRIPQAVQIKVGFGKRGGVRIFVNSKKAPHARPLEFPNRGLMVRHPVFGDRENWVETPGRPFFFKTVRKHEQKVIAGISQAIDKAVQGL